MKNTSVRAARLSAQGLSGRLARRPEDVVHRLLAVQAQDERAARLTIRSRSTGLAVADVDTALTEHRSLVLTWLNRGTLHLIEAADYWWLHALTTPQIAPANRRRLAQEGVSAREADRGVDVIHEAVSREGPQTRAELKHRLDAALVPTAGQALVHVLIAASLRGLVVRGPMRGPDHAYVAVSEWLGAEPEPYERSEALARLGRRYLAGHGPADAHDLAKWAGVKLGDARIAFVQIEGETVTRADGLVDLAERQKSAPVPKPRLLGPFDPLLHGWVSREPFVGSHRVVTTNGIFRACVLVDGRVVGTWRLSGTTLTIAPLEPLTAATITALRAEGADVIRFLDLSDRTRVVVDD